MAPITVWAERPEFVVATVQVVDAADVAVSFEAEAFEFKGKVDGKDVVMKLELKGEIKPEDSTFTNTGREVQIKMSKKEEGPYWNGLTKKKMNNVKVDWAKWKDEDELEGDAGLGDFGMGGMPGGMGGMPGGMGGMPGGAGGMGGMDMASMMQQMGGAGGAGGMPGGMGGMDMAAMMQQMGGAGGMGGMEMPEGGDSDDEEPPAAESK